MFCLPKTAWPPTFDATSVVSAAYLYRVVAQNAVGYGAEFPSMTVQSMSDTLGVNPPLAPSTLAGTLQAGPQIRLTWKDNSSTETSFLLQRATDKSDRSHVVL